jgi:hypothetical protein
MRRRHSSHTWKTAAAEASVKGAPFFGAFIGAKRRPFTATAAEAIARERDGKSIPPLSFAFNTLTLVSRKVAIWQPRFHEFYP